MSGEQTCIRRSCRLPARSSVGGTSRGFVRRSKACVFTGPILRDADEPDELILDGAVVAQEFWKLVVTVNAEEKGLHATAYVLSQGQLIQKLLEKRSKTEALEGVTLGEYRTFQVAVKDLGDATGYDFTAYEFADPLRQLELGEEAIVRGEPVYVSIESMANIVL